MTELLHTITELETADRDKQELVNSIVESTKDAGYEIVEVDASRPWGAFIKIDNAQADRFVEEFFPGLTPEEARLGVEGAELSPKFLIFAPNQRLSWQYHHNRAERWKFLTKGHYTRSMDDVETEPKVAEPGEEVQFARGERHRGGAFDNYTLVAEIWQHVNPDQLSNEDDIVRVSDDYRRS